MSDETESASEPIHVFICYRRVDGKGAAQWLRDHLQNRSIELSRNDESKTLRKLNVYLDTATPAVSNWKIYHRRLLEHSRAMLVVASPGLGMRLDKDDFVHQELDWWIRHRKQAPILVDPTGEGERWLPDSIRRKWPNAQRIELDLESWQALDKAQRSDKAAHLVDRIIGGIRESEAATTFEDLLKMRRLARRLRLFLILSIILLAMAGWGWLQAVRQERLAEARRLAAEAEFTLGVRRNGLIPSGFLALDSLRKAETAEGHRISQKVLSLLPRKMGKTQFEGNFRQAAISPTGKLVVATASAVTCFDTEDGSRLASKDINLVHAMAVHETEDGIIVALARKAELEETQVVGAPLLYSDNAVVLWTVSSGDVKYFGSDLDEITNVSFSPDGKHLAYSGWRSVEGVPSTEVIARIRALEDDYEWQLNLLREPVEVMTFRTNELLVTGGRSLRLWQWQDKPKRGMEAPDYVEHEFKPKFTRPTGSSIRSLSARANVMAVFLSEFKLWRYARLLSPGEKKNKSGWTFDWVATPPVSADSLVFNSVRISTTIDGSTARVWRVPLDPEEGISLKELARMPHRTPVLASMVKQDDMQDIRTVTTDGITNWSHSSTRVKTPNDGGRLPGAELMHELSIRLKAIDLLDK